MATALLGSIRSIFNKDTSIQRVDSEKGQDTSSSSSSIMAFKSSEVISDVVLGLADGLTVPFALTAGLSSLGSSKLVITGGLAEIISGAISMGIGGYLAAKAECDAYKVEAKRTTVASECGGDMESRVRACLIPYVKCDQVVTIQPFIEAITKEKTNLAAFLLRFESGLEPVDVHRPWKSAITIALSYVLGGLIPMIPYFVLDKASTALYISIAITGVILLVFGYIKSLVTCSGNSVLFHIWGSIQTLFVGAAAAGASYGLVRAIG